MATLVVEISGPRVGSTSFRKKLQAFPNVAAFGELFNPTAGPIGLGFPEHLLLPFTEEAKDRGIQMEPNYRALNACIAKDPIGAVDIALAASTKQGFDMVVLKLAPGHLETRNFIEIVRRFRPIGAILYRSPIDQFISREKAFKTKAWKEVDTTELRPIISAKAFLAWRWRQQHHLQMGRYIFERERRPYFVLSYEELYEREADPIQLLRTRFGTVGIALGEADAVADDLPKQDRSKSHADKVANWRDFEKDVENIGGKTKFDTLDLKGNPLRLRAHLFAETTLPWHILRRLAGLAGVSGMPQRGSN